MNEPAHDALSGPRWRPLPAIDRRVFGVLLEKAKTTPDIYPMSANAIRSGCNQKNNRYPLMEVDEDDVLESLERLRAVGAAVEIQGSSRVRKFKHLFYEWLGVDKVEAAVMAELLLRGTQTEGELRGRAARMEPIADVAALRPILHSLKSKGLVLSLTPEGRGHVVTHALYEPRELEKQKAEVAAGRLGDALLPDSTGAAPLATSAPHTAPVHVAPVPASAASPASASPATVGANSANTAVSASAQSAFHDEIAALRKELASLRGEVTKLRQDVDDLWSNLR